MGGKFTLQIAGAISGLFLAWVVQPLVAPPHTAIVKVELADASVVPDLVQHAREWTRSIMRARQPEYAGPMGTIFRRPSGHAGQVVFAIRSGDRELSLEVVRRVVELMTETLGSGIRIVTPPGIEFFGSDVSPGFLFAGAAVGWLAALALLTGRGARSEAATRT